MYKVGTPSVHLRPYTIKLLKYLQKLWVQGLIFHLTFALKLLFIPVRSSLAQVKRRHLGLNRFNKKIVSHLGTSRYFYVILKKEPSVRYHKYIN